MRVKLKVCGMRELENIKEVSSLQPDFMGFIFYSGSPRCILADFEMPQLPASIKKVGVFVNESVDRIESLIPKHGLDFVQLHGHETPEQCEKLKNSNVKVIKTFSVDEHFDFSRTKSFEGSVDYFLFDTKGKSHGGNGQVFNWELLQKYDDTVPFFLSGGLSPENIHAVSRLRDMNLFAVDINSGVEVKPGLKDVSQLKVLRSELLKVLI
jgi:phosphoribosylanthranilate isomerase